MGALTTPFESVAALATGTEAIFKRPHTNTKRTRIADAIVHARTEGTFVRKPGPSSGGGSSPLCRHLRMLYNIAAQISAATGADRAVKIVIVCLISSICTEADIPISQAGAHDNASPATVKTSHSQKMPRTSTRCHQRVSAGASLGGVT